MSKLTKIFGTHSQRELKRIYPIVDKVESYRDQMVALSDDELQAKTKEFKDRLEKGETLDDLLPEAYATVREAARRVLGMEHYRVQIIGGIILHQGRIAEMKTGEGKTLVSTLPAYLNALEGKGVCIVTVNDYLAKRDSEWMGKVHEFLGLKVGVVLNEMDNDERREAYNCDITYITNNELGFDYLRDNMVIYKEQLVQRGLHYAIIDEVDSVLIDEARTPLIISGQSGKSTKLYEACDILAKQLTRGEDVPEYSKMDAIMGIEQEETGDFIVNEKDKIVNLTQQGVHKVEQFFHIDNLADADNLEIQHNVILALRAHYLMFRDQDYVVKDDQVMIVDEFTGRLMYGRRFNDEWRRFRAGFNMKFLNNFKINNVWNIGGMDGLESYTRDDSLYIESIKRSQERTLIILAHIEKMLELYHVWCQQNGTEEDVRRYEVVMETYIREPKKSVQEIAGTFGIERRTVYKDINAAIQPLTALFFGIDAVKAA